METITPVFFEKLITSFLLITPRLIGMTIFISFLHSPQMPLMARNAFIFALSLFILPMVWHDDPPQIKSFLFFTLALKEILVGAILGFFVQLTFAIPQAMGDFIDNQRGASIASLFNPAFGGQASPMGLFLSQAFLVWFVLSGGWFLLLQLIFTSFEILSPFAFLPESHLLLWSHIVKSFSLFLRLALVIAAPVILSMLISEIALGLVSRFAPQLNVFFISMSLKSVIAITLLLFYLTQSLQQIWRKGLFFDQASFFLKGG